MALAQEVGEGQSPYGGGMAGDVSAFAVAEQDLIAVEWRYLDSGDGVMDTSAPDFSIKGFGDLEGRAQRFADEADVALAFAVSGETETDVPDKSCWRMP
ncbi:MAG: hypothetical protein AAF216_11370 [Pseudomonadota bacterium]